MTDDGVSVSSLTWVARRVDADALRQARRFAQLLGIAVLVDEPDKLVLQTRVGDLLEYCTPVQDAPDYLFAGQETVLGFLVNELDHAVAALADAGFPAITEPRSDGPVRFQHVRGPGDVAYGFIQRLNEEK